MQPETERALVYETPSVRHDIAGVCAREADGAVCELQSLPQWQRTFCDALRTHHGVVILACQAARVSRASAYRWRRESPTFARAWDAAAEEGRDEEMGALFHAAVKGDFEPVYEGEEIVAYVRRRSMNAARVFLARRGSEGAGR